jgi:hypothetical protein
MLFSSQVQEGTGVPVPGVYRSAIGRRNSGSSFLMMGDLIPLRNKNSRSGLISAPVSLFPDNCDRPVSIDFPGSFPKKPHSCPDCHYRCVIRKKTGQYTAGFILGSVTGIIQGLDGRNAETHGDRCRRNIDDLYPADSTVGIPPDGVVLPFYRRRHVGRKCRTIQDRNK